MFYCSFCEICYLNCEGKMDGNYLYNLWWCNLYYKCDGERFINEYCLSGIVFDRVKRICEVGGIC